MKIVFTIFYGLTLAIVTLVKATDVITRLMAKLYARRLQNAKVYLADVRSEQNQSIIQRWTELESYVDWLDTRIAGPPGAFGKHVQAVSNQEIDDLIKQCAAFSKVVNKAQRKERQMIKDKLRRIKHDYKALRHNVARNDAR